jgi:hypothetical protein
LAMPDDATPQSSKKLLRVELVAQKSDSKSKWEHPLVIAFFGFLLTGIVGSIISYQIQRRNAEIDRNAKHYEASTTAIAGFSDLLYTRYVRAGFLHSALKRRAKKEEIVERKRLYDQAVVAQESGLFGKELLIREALLEHQYSSFESLYDNRVRPAFHRVDDLLTVATDRYLQDAKTELPFNDIKTAYDESRNCGYALINLVFLEVSSKHYVGKGGSPCVHVTKHCKTSMLSALSRVLKAFLNDVSASGVSDLRTHIGCPSQAREASII